MANMLHGIISITISAVILGNVFITTIKGTSTTYGSSCGVAGNESCSWTTAEIAMWGLLTLIGIVGLVYGVLNVFGLA